MADTATKTRETSTLSPVTILAICTTCGETRYRSKIAISDPSQCKPENFAPVGDAPPADGAAPPLCHVCGSMLNFTSEEKWNQTLTSRRTVASGAAPSPSVEARIVETRAGTIETLFAVSNGETVKDIRDVPGGLLVITDRRIVRVNIHG